MVPSRWLLGLLLAALPAAAAGQERIVISEFLAQNDGPVVDEDGEKPDWIELLNAGAAAVDIGGWHLTDARDDLRRWPIPAARLEPGQFLLVFASGKDRRQPGFPFHTNFRLDAGGEYLALVKPDGVTIAHEIAPSYPPQRAGVSFGLGRAQTLRSIVPPRSPLRALVPAGAAAGPDWTGGQEPFDDSGWISGASGLGYIAEVSGLAVRNAYAKVTVGSLATAEQVLGDPGLQFGVFSENAPYIDYLGTSASGHYPDNRPFPGSSPGGDEDNFVIEATARITIPAAGPWTFGVMSDDGFGLDITDGVDAFRIEHPDVRGPGDTLGTFDVRAPGDYDLRLVFYERGGGSGVELFAAPGSFTTWNSTDFRRVGDAAAGGLAARSQVVASGGSSSGFRAHIGTDIEGVMRGVNSTVYARIPFSLADPAALRSLTLRVRYDDGFAAFLNGVEVARRNAPAVLGWNSSALTDRPSLLAAAGEDINISGRLGLLRPGANVLALHGLNDAPSSPEFLLDAELAEVEDALGSWRFFDEPTPGLPNGEGFLGLVADTKFDPDRGFFNAPFDVGITSATPGARIYYTLDGTVPGPEKGFLYNRPVPIERTTVLRAMAVLDGYLPTNADAQTYIFPDDVILQDYQATLDAGFPPTWGGTSPDYGMDMAVIGQNGTDGYGGKYAATIRDDLLAIPTLSISMDAADLFGPNGIYTNSTARGIAWERPASAELIHADGSPGFQINCGIRIQGGAFRSHGLTKKHSFRLLFKAIYGPSRLEYRLFSDPRASDRFDTLTLRANANDGWQWSSAGSRPVYIRDSFGRETVLAMGGAASHETFVHLYLNGIYWGLYNPVERPDHSFSATYFGGDKDDWDSVSNNAATNGDLAAWNTLLSMAAAGLASDAAYQAAQGNNPDGTDNPLLESFLDPLNLADYMITNLYVGNTDWPHKNWWIGRRRTDSTGFKFYMWDSEWSLGLNSNLGTNQTGVSNGVAAPYAAARANAEFRMLFADRLHKHFFNGGALYVDPASPAWDPSHPERNMPAARFMGLADAVGRAVVAESARWGDQHVSPGYTRDEHWQVERDNLIASYFPYRSAAVLQQFRAAGLYPAVSAPVFNQHGGAVPPGFPLEISAPSGETYYTLDGSDPRLAGGALSSAALLAGTAQVLTLLPSGAGARILVPRDGSLGLAWTLPGFDDSAWTAGPTGIGYERQAGYEALLGTDVGAAMVNINSSVYVRIPFPVADPAQFSILTLRMKYDDGFIAYLNGFQVAERNAPQPPLGPAWNSDASAGHADSEAVVFEDIDISSAIPLLQPGANLLAIHGLNAGSGSSDLLILPEIAAASSSGQAIVLDRTSRVRARALLDGNWSALNEAIFVVEGELPLRVTEIHYHPAALPPGSAGDPDDFEFIELRNTGDRPIGLLGVRFTAGIEFDFTNSTVTGLGPGEYTVLVKNLDAFTARYGAIPAPIAGVYSGNLGNSGDFIILEGPLGETLLEFFYDDDWQPATDGGGYSLTIIDDRAPAASWADPASWRPSGPPDGTPGAPDAGDGAAGGFQLPGDSNQDGAADIADAVSILLHLFDGGRALPCAGASIADGGNRVLLDLNGDAAVDISDAVHLLAYLFRGGPPPALGTRCIRIPGCPERCR